MLALLIVLIAAIAFIIACRVDRWEQQRNQAFWEAEEAERRRRQQARAELHLLNDGSWTAWLDELAATNGRSSTHGRAAA